VIDGRGRFLVPGLIDTHVHLDAPMVFQITEDERAQILAHTPLAFLYNGVTTVFNLSSDADWIWKQRDEERAGRLLSPRIYATGRSFTPEGGWGSRHGGALKTADEARALARDFIAHRTDGFKVMIEDGLGGSGTYRVMPDDILRAIADEARQGRVPIYVHAINLSEWRLALPMAPRGIMHGLEDPLPDGDPLPSQLVASGIFVVPTISLFEAFTSFDGHPERFDDPILKASVPSFLLANMRRSDYLKVEKTKFQEVARMDVYPWASRAVPIFKANTAKLFKAGVRLAVGTDAGGPVGYNFQGYNTPREIELLVESGLTPLDALVAATRNGAALIGVDRELGTIEPGKRADLLLLAADPLADIRNIRRIETVVLKGVAYPRERFAYHPAPATQVR
jgi:imidazolonepropionase-like amidohydrolase